MVNCNSIGHRQEIHTLLHRGHCPLTGRVRLSRQERHIPPNRPAIPPPCRYARDALHRHGQRFASHPTWGNLLATVFSPPRELLTQTVSPMLSPHVVVKGASEGTGNPGTQETWQNPSTVSRLPWTHSISHGAPSPELLPWNAESRPSPFPQPDIFA